MSGLLKFTQLAKLGKANFDVNVCNEGGDTALMCAARMGYADVVRTLVTELHADVNARNSNGKTVLMHAINSNDIHSMATLLSVPELVFTEKCICLMLDLFVIAVNEGDIKKLSLLINALGNRIDEIRFKNGDTLLTFAAKNGYVELVKELLHAGANVDLPDKDGFST